jgi:hypothetical protein
MDHKSLKQDLTYALKKLQKDGKVLTAYGDNLEIKDKAFVETNQSDPLEALVMMKGYAPTADLLQGYNISLIDLLVKETEIPKDDWYAFLDGFDNIISYGKNEYYNVGVYLREKFAPLGARAVPSEPIVFFGHTLSGEITNKYVINSIRGKTSILEVKCEKVLSIDQAYSVSLKEGEYKVRILEPSTLFEKKPNGVMVPPIYVSYFLYDSLEEAKAKAEKDTRAEFARQLRKKQIAFTEEDVQAKLLTIQTIKL